MCLAIPGQIVSLANPLSGEERGQVRFGGVVKEISLVFTPEAAVGDYVIVHAGFALSRLDEDEAQASLADFAALAEMESRDS